MSISTGQLLHTLINEWWSRPLPKIHKRNVDLRNFVTFNEGIHPDQVPLELNDSVRKVISVIGFRRVGKTYLLLDFARTIGQQNCVYINFEDERIPRSVSVLTELLDVLTEISRGRSYYLLLDEIQNIPEWSLWARRVIETTSHRLIISGSSSKLASSELPTELRGRSLSVKVDPLTFPEFLRFKNSDLTILSTAQILSYLREFLIYGGFPEVVLSDEGKKYLLIDEYFQTFIQRDIVERHKLRRPQTLAFLINLLLNSKEFGVRKLSNTITSLDNKIGKYTVTRYISYLQETFFLKVLYLHAANLKKRTQAQKKAYFVDSSFIARKTNIFSDNIGRLMEQKVAEHISARVESGLNSEIFYWKDNRGGEVDFVVRKGEEVINLTQVCYLDSGITNLPGRELKGLLKAAHNLKCNDLEIVTWNIEHELEVEGYKVKLIPLWKYLTAN